MVVVLDTNHFTEMVDGSAPGLRLLQEIQCKAVKGVATTIITAQEVLAGWFAEINRRPAGERQVPAYGQFQKNLASLEKITILPFGSAEAEIFSGLRLEYPGTGTMDLKIAAICIVHDALLLTRNLVDFEKLPGLRVENWLD